MTVAEMARQIAEKQKQIYALHAPDVQHSEEYWANVRKIFEDCYSRGLREGFITRLEWAGEEVTLGS